MIMVAGSEAVHPGDRELVRPKAILFDWDNTLIDSWAIIHDAINWTFQAHGLCPWTLEETREKVRMSMRDSFPGMFGGDWQRAADTFYERFDAIHLEMLTPLEGAGEMLERLSISGIYLGVVSNKRGSYLRREAKHLGWDRHFSSLVGALDAERDKPAPDPVLLALSASAISPGADVWFVGDADIDMECALNAGITPILLRQEPMKEGEFTEYHPHRHLGSCQELCKLVDSM